MAKKRLIKLFTLYSLLFTLLIPLFPVQVQGAPFNPDFIISDSELIDYKAMSEKTIHEFLNRWGTLGSYTTENIYGEKKKVSEIIWEASQKFRLNPQFLLALLQKEQSLITTTNPSQRQYDWATGFSCYGGKCNNDYKGFGKQVYYAAQKMRERYLNELEQNGRTFTGWGPGITKTTLDGINVTPLNKATACLYTYNPYQGGTVIEGRLIGANYNFWKIWNCWFTKIYPDGTLLQEEESPGVWLIQNDLKRPFLTRGALLSRYDPQKIIVTPKGNLQRYETGKPIKFAEYSLLESPKGTVYLLVGDNRRGIASSEVFRSIGFSREEVIKVDWEDLEIYPEEKPITMKSIYPTGALLQNRDTGGVYFIEEGVKYPIWSRELLKTNFKGREIIAIREEELSKFPTGDPVKFKDGELVASREGRSVYIISQGEKRPFATREVLEGLGYKWENVIWTTPVALSLHPAGEPVYLISEEVKIAMTNRNK